MPYVVGADEGIHDTLLPPGSHTDLNVIEQGGDDWHNVRWCVWTLMIYCILTISQSVFTQDHGHAPGEEGVIIPIVFDIDLVDPWRLNVILGCGGGR